jgi:CubicO group peptidase (beta-lactamase class C family)
LRSFSGYSLVLLIGLTAALPATAADWEALADSLDALRRDASVPAMGLVILDQGQPVIVRAFGSAEVDTPFRWGSITKSFTALAALQLAQQHDLPLTSEIRPILGPGYFRNSFAGSRPIRLIDLLTLSAGFGDLTGTEFSDNEPHDLWDALQKNTDRRSTLWPPGLQHSYTNVPPGLTSAVIEKTSGRTFEQYLQQQVFEPLGMAGASLAPIAGLPGGFRADGETEIPYWHMTFKGFGALNTSTREMSRFAETLLNNGRRDGVRVFSEGLVEQFFTPAASLGVDAGLEVSYAAGVYGRVRNGHLFWVHGGDADGYRAGYGLLRVHGRGYAVVFNTDNPQLLRRMVRLLESGLTEDLAPHPPLLSVPEPLEPYAGTYYPSSVRFASDRWSRGEASTATVRHSGDTLEFIRGSSRTTLIPLGAGRFIRPDDPAVTAVFVRDAAGSLYLQGELGNFVSLSEGPCPGFIAACE